MHFIWYWLISLEACVSRKLTSWRMLRMISASIDYKYNFACRFNVNLQRVWGWFFCSAPQGVYVSVMNIGSIYHASFSQQSRRDSIWNHKTEFNLAIGRQFQTLIMPTEAVVAIPLGCLSLLIVVTNSFVCLLVYLHVKLRSYTNGFVVSLAVSDILTGALLLPLYISVPEFNGTDYIVSAILLTGVANVCAVTLDRYLAIAKPFIYYAVMTRHFVKFIVGSWVLPMVISIIPLIWGSNPGLAHTVYLFLLQGLGVVVPYIYVCIAYYLIFHEARHIVRRLRRESSLSWRSHEDKNKGRKNSNTVASEAKVAKMFALIAISFILSWMPVLYLTSVMSAVGDKPELVDKLSPVWLLDFSLFTVALGSMVNPVVYSFFKPDFRSIIKRMLRKQPQWSSLKHSQNCVIDVPLILKRLESGKEVKETYLWTLLTLRSKYISRKFPEITAKCRHKSIYYSLVSLYTNLFHSALH